MWIRNQDKHFLVNACAFEISDDDVFDGVNYLIIGLSNNTSYLLGKYSTEEKALKVLDEIQKYIGRERFYSTTKGISEQQSISIENTNVFKMPQDEDVKI